MGDGSAGAQVDFRHLLREGRTSRCNPARATVESFAGAPPPGRDVFAELPYRFAVVRHALARALGIPPGSIAGNATLSQLGIDSIRALRAQVHLQRTFGLHLPLTALTPDLAAEDAAQALSVTGLPPVQKAAPASTRTYPLLPLQQAYWLGRATDRAPSNVYFEIAATEIDVRRLERALNALIQAHPSLRTIVRDGVTQEVLDHPPPYAVIEHDLSEANAAAVAAHLQSIRAEWSHLARDPQSWPLFDVGVSTGCPATRLSARRSIRSTLDIASIRLLASQCLALYRRPHRALDDTHLSFLDFVQHFHGSLRSSSKYEADRVYWAARLPNLPGPPSLPRRNVTPAGPQRYERLSST